MSSPILNALPSEGTDTDFDLAAAGPLPPAPASADWSADWWPVGDQGETGACVGWVVADGLLRRQFAEAGRLAHAERLSVRFIWMASKETDDIVGQPTTFIEAAGTRLKAALTVAVRYGCVTEQVLGLDTAQLYAGQTDGFYALAERYRPRSYHNLSLSRGHSPADWRQWIGACGPLAVRLNVDAAFMLPPGGLLSEYRPAEARYGHVA